MHFFYEGMSILEHFVSCSLKWGPIFSKFSEWGHLGGGGEGAQTSAVGHVPPCHPQSYVTERTLLTHICYLISARVLALPRVLCTRTSYARIYEPRYARRRLRMRHVVALVAHCFSNPSSPWP